MKTTKKLRTFCVDAKKVQNFFAKLSNNVTSGCEKVWVSEERNGELSFLIGNERIRMSEASLKKGGMI